LQKKIETVKTLLEALPFIKEFNKEIVVISTVVQLKHHHSSKKNLQKIFY